MLLAATDSFVYKFVFLLHLSMVIVGFGTSFAWPALAAKARKIQGAEGYAITHSALELGKGLTTIPIWLAGFFGIVLVVVSDDVWKFSQTWISAAFAVFLFSAAFAMFVHTPNIKKMDELQAKLLSGEATPTQGGPPAEVLELQARGKRAGMTGGVLHLAWLVLMVIMIWKPGLG